MLNDKSPMPYGIHKGTPMIDVPAGYLLWLLENNKCSGEVKEYIEDNLDALKLEIKNTPAWRK